MCVCFVKNKTSACVRSMKQIIRKKKKLKTNLKQIKETVKKTNRLSENYIQLMDFFNI